MEPKDGGPVRDLSAHILGAALIAAETERDQLRAELAAAVAEQNRMAREIDEALCGDGASRQASLCDLIMPVRLLRLDRDQLRARLAAIDNAPTLSWSLHGNELIARPAKE